MRDEQRTGLILHPARDLDPRLTLDEGALVLASRNAYPVVAARKPRRDTGGLVAGGAVALLLGGLTFWSMSGHRIQPRQAPAPVLAVPRPAPPVAAPIQLAAQRPLLTPGPSLVTPAPAPLVPAQPAPIMVYDTGAAQPVAAPVAPSRLASSEPTRPPQAFAGVGGETEQFAQRVGVGSVDVASARRLTDPASTITQGTLIPAVLETAIDTDLPGYVRALVSADVRSFDGAHVLVPRSSRLIGQYKSGLSAGQTRAYVIWTRLIRPDGASVALGSPAVDFAGRSGLTGEVNSHFMKRFGSAVLLSVVGGLSAIGNSSVVLAGGQSAASVAAQRDTQIPPTIRVPQGQPIRIFTAKDLDFSAVGPGE